MVAQISTGNWLESALEKPFLAAELARAEMTKVQSGQESMAPLALLAVYSAGMAAFSGYWATKLWF